VKQLAAILLLGTALITISGCTGGKAPVVADPSTLNSGNWLMIVNSITSTSDLYPQNRHFRGTMEAASNAVSANLSLSDEQSANCFPDSLVLSGSISSNTVTLTPVPNDSDLTITATVNPGGILLGTYNCTSQGAGADNGTVYATNIPPISGVWSGTLPESVSTWVPNPSGGGTISTTNYTIGAAATIIQSSTPAPSDSSRIPPYSFALGGTVTLTNSTCFISGSSTLTIDSTQSYINGEQVFISAVSADGTEGFTWGTSQRPISLDDPTTALSMLNPSNFSAFSGSCRFDTYYSASLTKSS
jgi:hypothetical protein